MRRRYRPIPVLTALGALCIAHIPSAAATLTAAEATTRCAPAVQRRDTWDDLAEGEACRVAAFGQVPGAMPPVFYQLQSYAPPASPPEQPREDDGAGAVLFARLADGRLATLAGWSGSGAVVAAPRGVRTPQGPLVVLPMSTTVSSHPTEDAVFRRLGRTWVEVSTEGWQTGVRVRGGVRQRHGNAMDWPTLRAFGAFWRPADAECCPTGGSYIARLRLDGTRLRLAGVRYSRGALPFP